MLIQLGVAFVLADKLGANVIRIPVEQSLDGVDPSEPRGQEILDFFPRLSDRIRLPAKSSGRWKGEIQFQDAIQLVLEDLAPESSHAGWNFTLEGGERVFVSSGDMVFFKEALLHPFSGGLGHSFSTISWNPGIVRRMFQTVILPTLNDVLDFATLSTGRDPEEVMDTEQDSTLFVHFRAGDVLTFRSSYHIVGKRMHQPPLAFYVRAIDTHLVRFPHAKIMLVTQVSSSLQNFCIQPILDMYPQAQLSGHTSAPESFNAMVYAKHLVLSRSSFSWMAALLAPDLKSLYSPDLPPARWSDAPFDFFYFDSPDYQISLTEAISSDWRLDPQALPLDLDFRLAGPTLDYDPHLVLCERLTEIDFVRTHSPEEVEDDVTSDEETTALVLAASRIQQQYGFVFFQLMNANFALMVRSWICQARRLPGLIDQVLFAATDSAVEQALQDMGAPNIVVLPYTTGNLVYGHRQYFNYMLFRAQNVLSLLQNSINVWLVEADATWFANPTPFIRELRDMDVVVGQDGSLIVRDDPSSRYHREHTPAIQENDEDNNLPEAGFIYLNATEATISMWDDLVEQHENLLEESGTEHLGDSGSEMRMLPQHLPKVRWTSFPRTRFVSGLWYEDTEFRKAVNPIVIQNNWIKGNEAKIDRARQWGHWFLLENNRTCTDTAHTGASREEGDMPSSSRNSLTFAEDLKSAPCFNIIVLTMNRANSLKRLLHSLEDADYGDDIVHLTIKIDFSSDNGEAKDAAEEFEFTHGPKKIVLATRNQGLRGAWLEAWVPADEEDFSIILEDDIVMSPDWYLFLRRAWSQYSECEDLAGISLMRQNLIAYYPRRTREIVNRHQPFLYSLVGTIAFSPHPMVWRSFLSWIGSIDLAKFDVSVPGLVTSDWWKGSDKRHMWSQHFIYFTKQHNLYTMYVNLPRNETLAAHMREKGAHYPGGEGQDFPLATAVKVTFPDRLCKYGWNGVLQAGEHCADKELAGVNEVGADDGEHDFELPWTCVNPEETNTCPNNPIRFCRGDIHMIFSLGVGRGDTLFNTSISGPIQTGQDVTDVKALFVADPFLIITGSAWYIFSEIVNNNCQKGEIGYHISTDEGRSWRYGKTVLREDWHVSFPFVIEHAGDFYMTTAASAGTVAPYVLWLYKATHFPLGWNKMIKLLDGQTQGYPLAPVLKLHNSMWYLFTLDDALGKERLFVSKSLFGPFAEHERSGIFEIRQSGRIVTDDDGMLWAFDHTATHVSAVPILTLTPKDIVYGSKREILGPRPHLAWAAAGMHTFSALRHPDGTWVVAVDGWWEDSSFNTYLCLDAGGSNCHKADIDT